MKNALNIAVTLSLTMSSFVPGSPMIKDWPNELQSNFMEQKKDQLVDTNNDGIYADWTHDAITKKGNEVLDIKDGWLHLASGVGNGNDTKNQASYPAMFVNPAEFDFNQPGFFATTMKTTQGAGKNRFGFYVGYENPGNGLFIGYDAGGWFWQKYQGGVGEFYQGTRVPEPVADAETKVRLEWDENKKAKLILDNQTVFENLDFANMTLTNKIGIKAGAYQTSFTDVYLKDIDYTGLKTSVDEVYTVSGKVIDERKAPVVDANITIGEHTVKTDNEGNFAFDRNFITGEYTLKIAKAGYKAYETPIAIANQNIVVGDITLTEEMFEIDEIASADMKVALYQGFPAVRKYEMTKLGNKVMYGQTRNLDTLQINDSLVKLKKEDVTYTKVSDSKATYTMHAKDDTANIDAIITAEMIVDENKLHFNITKIENNLDANKFPIQKLAIPDHSLVAVHSNEEGASFTGAAMSSNTTINGDETFAVTDRMNELKNRDYMYAFVSNNELSASMWSNSENEGRVVAAPVFGGSHNTRIFATTSEGEDYTSLGLASAPWYYHRVVKDSKGNSYQVPETEMPKMSIVITADENADKNVNWQDSAIAFRSIMNNPFKSEEVPELVAWRIAMNFGGQAQNPFLTTLDNVKKVALHTDGLGQSVLLKGYGNEGHDSGHPDYGDIGKRIGGAKDMNTMMEKGKAYGARFGIHVNASEMYPEAKAFNEDMVRRNEDGGLRYGWNWLDQGIGIDGIYDLASGAREDRFAQLKEQVGDNMDFIYLDVWGNRTASLEDSWETRKISKTIIDNGWRMTTEWGPGNEYDSTFQHWATDLTYGSATSKGENSQVMRFLRNHQKDSWVGDYPTYGGAANAPLLGGYNMKDFEGWQGRNDYDEYIRNLYTHDVSTKFIQHFQVEQWLNNPLDETAPKDASVNNGNEEITLADKDGNRLIIRRGSNDVNNAEYRKRTMVLNGKVVLDGKVSKGDGKGKGDEAYLLPWNWNAETGETVASEDEKLYHWNTTGGTTTWDVPESWKTLGSVNVYKLTDLGKVDEQTIPVVNGQVTLAATGETPYVVCKGSEAEIEVTWSEGMHIVDAGFNGGVESLDKHWKKEGKGEASIAKSQFSNPMLKLTGDVSTTQTLTGLSAGKQYAMYVGVDKRSDGTAMASVRSNGKVISENYTNESIAKNYIQANPHNTKSATVDGSSYFQNIYVFFTAPKDGSPVELSLSHNGSGDAYFDDIRVVENTANTIELNEDGQLQSFTNDFENNVQGIYPFVVGGSEGVVDNRVHLSEKNAPYTQAGWDVKKMDDVLNGNWSIKANGLTNRSNMVFQTIPQNVRFEPGVKYKVSFQYQTGSNGTYALANGAGEFNPNTVDLTPLDKALGTTAEHSFELIGGLHGDSWFGIYSTNVAPDTQGTTGAASKFGGYLDFVLDDVKIERVDESFTKEDTLIKLEEIASKYTQSNVSKEAWQVYQEVLVQARVMINKDNATEEDYVKAYTLLRSLDVYMDAAPGTETEKRYDVVREDYDISAGSAQANSAGLAQDNVDTTHWHTSWTDKNLNNAWYQFDLKKPTTIDGLRYLPRTGAANANGKVKSYSISLKKADGTTEEITGTFNTTTAWQKKSFEKEIENVVSVRFHVKTSAGQSVNEENVFAAIAELRLTEPKEAEAAAPVDKTKLENLVVTADVLVEKDYEPVSWNYFAEKLAQAKEVMNKGIQRDTKADEATAYEVALAYENLKNAMDALQPVVAPEIDRSKLHAAIQDAEAKNTDVYTSESVAAMHAALTSAKEVVNLTEATQKMVDDATEALTKAIAELKVKEELVVDKNELKTKLASAMQLDENKYTKESYQALTNAIAKAQAVIANANATQAEVDLAYAALNTAIMELKEVVIVDKTQLIQKLATAAQVDEQQYSAESYQALVDAITKAQAVIANANATQAEVQDAYLALNKAMQELKLKEEIVITKDALMRKLASAIQVNKNKYTAESYQVLASAIAKAQAVLANANATQKEIKEAYDLLDKAMNHLVVAPNTGKPGGSGSVNSGDSTNMGLYVPLAILSSGAVIFLINKKRKQEKER